MTQTTDLQRITSRYGGGWVGAVRWITKDGERKAVHGKVTGKTTGAKGGQYLVIRATGGEKAFVPFTGIIRELDAAAEQQQRDELLRADRCEECGKTLGAGFHGFLDESVVAGLCFNCA